MCRSRRGFVEPSRNTPTSHGTCRRLQDAIAALPAHHSREARAAWLAQARAGEVADLAGGLIRDHYDPAYRRSTARSARVSLGQVRWDGTDGAMAGAADAVTGLVEAQAR